MDQAEDKISEPDDEVEELDFSTKDQEKIKST